MVLPDGTKYESDGSGNVYQDGEQIKQGGAWIDNSESANAAPDETNTDEPNTEDPPEGPAEAPSGNPLSADRVAGTYHVSGYDAWVDFEDELYNYHDSASTDIIITAQEENMLTLSAAASSMPEGMYADIVIPILYDPSTGSCVITDEDGMRVSIQFSESGGVYSVRFSYDQILSDGHAYGEYTGTKK